MVLTNLQKKASNELKMSKVIYRNMWEDEGSLGYTSKGKNGYYDINIAKDFPNNEAKAIILMHEVGHIYYGHDDIDLRAELKTIEHLCEVLGYSPMDLAFYGGVMRFLNIAMDFEVNTKLLTKSNMDFLSKCGVGGVLPSQMGIPYKKDFRDYYVELIKKINPSNLEKSKDLQKKLSMDMAEGVKAEDLEGLSEEMQEAIIEESYDDGNTKAQKKDKVETKTLEESVRGYTRLGGASEEIEVAEVDVNTKLVSFFKKLVHVSRQRQSDSLKHYNRRTRVNPNNILYPSQKMKTMKDRQKLAIVVDVSGSMELEAISCAIQSLRGCFSQLNKDSKVITWTTQLEEEFPITKIPRLINACGGTDINSALDYLKGKGYNDVVIFSDMETWIPPMIQTAKDGAFNIHTIYVDMWDMGASGYLKEFLDLNKTTIRLTQKDFKK